jgi:hypothetical protein
MFRALRFGLAMAMVLVASIGFMTPTTRAQLPVCSDIHYTVPYGGPYASAFGVVYYAALDAGDVLFIENAQSSDPDHLAIYLDTSFVSGPYPSLSYTVPASGQYVVTFIFYSNSEPVALGFTLGCRSASTSETTSETTPSPGCDVFLPLTDTSVVGEFTATTTAYWMPGEITNTVIEAGKTAWVLGEDASGQYYKIIWSCDTL